MWGSMIWKGSVGTIIKVNHKACNLPLTNCFKIKLHSGRVGAFLHTRAKRRCGIGNFERVE